MRIFVDDAVCSLNGECTFAAPDVFSIDGDVLVFEPEVSPEQEEAVREAVDACPNQAILLEEDE